MSKRKDIAYWVTFSQIPEIGPKRFKLLCNYFPNLQTAWQAPREQLRAAGLEEKLVYQVLTQRQTIDPQAELMKLKKYQISVVTIKDADYPQLLKEIPDAPALLYYRGELPKDQFNLSVVGTRKLSNYGRRATEEIVGYLARNRITVISGLALGIDQLSHQVTLDNLGKTIAVLANGLDQTFPQENYHLGQKIIQAGGAIISEYSIGRPALKQHFPCRNRIIAGLSLGTLVIEAGTKSGALITAYLSLDYNREVFALPGSIFSPQSAGTNKLIRQGAILVQTGQDILDALDLKTVANYKQTQRFLPANETEGKLLNNLTAEPKHINLLIKETKLPITTVNSTLIVMEMKGLIKDLGGQMYIKK